MQINKLNTVEITWLIKFFRGEIKHLETVIKKQFYKEDKEYKIITESGGEWNYKKYPKYEKIVETIIDYDITTGKLTHELAKRLSKLNLLNAD